MARQAVDGSGAVRHPNDRSAVRPEFCLADAPALAADVVEQTVYALATVGYSLIPGFLEETACLALRAGLEDAVASYVALGSERSYLDRYLLHDLLCRNLLFGRLLEDPRLQQLLSPLLGPYWTLYAFTSSSLPPSDSNHGRRIHIDSPRFVPGFPFNIGVLWALDDFTAENGGTEVLPGSHHSEKLPTEAFFDAHKHQVQCSRGSLLIFNARVAHRSGMNHTSEFRHALTMNVC